MPCINKVSFAQPEYSSEYAFTAKTPRIWRFLLPLQGARGGGAAPAAAAQQPSQPQPRQPHIVPPGAYSVPGNPSRRQNQQFYVTVPRGVRPGHEFPVLAGGHQLMVRCPTGVRAGDRIVVSAPNRRGTEAYMATVPAGIGPGDQFPVLVNNQQMMVTCPPGVGPGMQVRIMVPSQPQRQAPQPSSSPFGDTMYEVVVPQGVRPGQPFALIANGQRVMVTCPQRAAPGQKIQFRLPIQMSNEEIQSIKLNYEKEGWTRCLTTELQFVWLRQEKTDDKKPAGEPAHGADRITRDKVDKIAFVRALTPDAAGTGGTAIGLVPAQDAAASTLVNGRSLAQDLAKHVTAPFQTKEAWFRGQISQLQVPWEEGHIRINVRRSNLLVDAMEAIESVKKEDMRKTFRFEFQGEQGIDAGGVAREFFQLTSEHLFNPDVALFSYSAINQMCMQINPMSGFCNEEHLRYFHFCGRLLGKALFDRQLVNAHLVQCLYKHILGWPVLTADLEALDADVHQNLMKLLDLDDVSVCDLDFTATVNAMGENKVEELKPGGEAITVTNENLEEYLALQCRYRLLGRVSEQVKHLLMGFYDVVDEPLLSVFDYQELELLLCGLPDIDVNDWKAQSEYTGEYEKKGVKHKVIMDFWSVVEEEFTPEQRARLLQFTTGTSGVPASGFAMLQGNDGNIRKFTINSLDKKTSIFPRAHTCFNRIDLPLYDNKKELKKYLTLAVQMECTGFDID
jgi:E3 ubiquitin-protein ligase NEDD4